MILLYAEITVYVYVLYMYVHTAVYVSLHLYLFLCDEKILQLINHIVYVVNLCMLYVKINGLL